MNGEMSPGIKLGAAFLTPQRNDCIMQVKLKGCMARAYGKRFRSIQGRKKRGTRVPRAQHNSEVTLPSNPATCETYCDVSPSAP